MAQINEPFTNNYKEDYHELISSLQLDLPESSILNNELVYLKNLKSTLDLLLLENTDNLDLYEDKLDEYIQYLEGLSDSDSNKLYLLAELDLKYALALFRFGHELEAAWHFRQAHKSIQKNIKLFPDFIANYKTSGVINIVLGAVPEKHQWLLKLIGLNGTIEEGIKQLNKLAKSNSSFNIEAIMITSILQAYVLNQPHLASASFYKSINLDGPLIQLLKIVLHLKNSNGAKALEEFEAGKDYDPLAFSYYLAGDAYIEKADYQKAEVQYLKFLDMYNGLSNKKDAHYKLWLCHYLTHDPSHLAYRDSAKLIVEGRSEADRYAAKILNQELPNREIMKLRLATDGGFYDLADQVIKNKPQLVNKKDSIEYSYRLARLFHKKGDVDSSIDLYKTVIINTNNEHWYFSPNSALMLGYIYMEKGDSESAEFYLRKAMSYKHHEYKNSIDAKAEAALNTISEH